MSKAPKGRWWTMVSPKRRQELSLGIGVGLGLVVSIVAVRWLGVAGGAPDRVEIF